ncbi:DNAdirected RNA polymerase II subunit rpb4, putative [Acanthamoeba castellanii str. Neff]|jgi:DNA-directed RNA polymerase II subunit RPB4|uniref:DNAdirected RNA polymerase II subunit rpb4, putative n=1 Tax=Acanthamoeba castellanii (strain ATCC 30010 / Neff) TaxID=1257118 RepID=L8HID4_ACACF|nr:DNAdirected RNA polymerase II subunit rpb4, putative [Acanthamoeba castellanii str. Neff]ELR25354.1 DNAdirected RNA polymerase II subunit rpb4, putative [Acanthamoeba castellanii str. Neff]
MAAQQEEEDASLLRLGLDFQNANCLLNSEVAILLEHRQQTAAVQEEGEAELSNVFLKTLSYVQRFSRYKTKAAVKEVRSLLTEKELEEFEIAALSNLCPETAEEAKSLIPSLAKRFDDEELQSVLNDLASFRRFE